jgi:hypothetical protein
MHFCHGLTACGGARGAAHALRGIARGMTHIAARGNMLCRMGGMHAGCTAALCKHACAVVYMVRVRVFSSECTCIVLKT